MWKTKTGSKSEEPVRPLQCCLFICLLCLFAAWKKPLSVMTKQCKYFPVVVAMCRRSAHFRTLYWLAKWVPEATNLISKQISERIQNIGISRIVNNIADGNFLARNQWNSRSQRDSRAVIFRTKLQKSTSSSHPNCLLWVTTRPTSPV